MAWSAAVIVLAGAVCMVTALAQSQSPPDSSAGHADLEATLPATDLSVERTRSSIRTQLEKGGRASSDFQSAALPRNPLAPEATSVGSKMCVSCHTVEQTQFPHTQHERAFKAGAMGGPGDATCETCHGPGSAHGLHAPTLRSPGMRFGPPTCA